MNKGAKRTKMDVHAYRLKAPSDVFPCIMASYTQQVHFDIDMLRSNGLYGGLLMQTEQPLTFRYLSAPEGLILMGLCQNLVIPPECKQHWKLIGNAIATPHAMIAMWNAARILSGDEAPTPSATQVFERLLQSTFRNSNTHWRSCPDGIMIDQDTGISQTGVYSCGRPPVPEVDHRVWEVEGDGLSSTPDSHSRCPQAPQC